jgi:hypothetical protein
VAIKAVSVFRQRCVEKEQLLLDVDTRRGRRVELFPPAKRPADMLWKADEVCFCKLTHA